MNARTSRSAKADPASTDNRDERTGLEPDLMFEDLLDARFDEKGRLSQVGRGNDQRTAERLDPRPAATSAEELEKAVQKLAAGLEAIERQSRGPRRPEPASTASAGGRDFVTYSLDRLEARLEALSRRLQSRATTADADEQKGEAESAPQRQETQADPSLAVEPDYAAESAELRRLAEVEAERVRRAAEAAAEERQREAAAEEARETEAEARRLAETEAAEAKRRAEEAAADARRQAEEEAAESRRRAEEEAADAKRRAEEAEAAERRQAAEAEQERMARAAEARRQAEEAAEMQRQFAEIEARVEALQRSADANQVAPVREELLELLHEIEDLTHNRNDVAAALNEINGRLSEMEVKVNAARNMAGNRLGDIQDRLSGLSERLDEVEVEIPGFDAIRENQGAIFERFDRMEGLVHQLASPEDLLARVDGLRQQLQTIASHEEVAQIEKRLLGLAERVDALPEDLSDAAALERIESQLAGLASELSDARAARETGAADLDQRLLELQTLLQEVGESGRTPDLSGLEERLTEFAARFDADRERSGEALTKIERRLAGIADAIEEQEGDAEILAGLTRKIDALSDAIEAQDARGTRSDIESLDSKLDQVAQQLADHAEHLSRAQVQPLEARLDHMQRQLDAFAQQAQASSDQLRPFAQKLQEISDRVSALGSADERTPLSLRLDAIEERLAGLSNGKGPDPRALQTQLDGIVSRLELLKGRSIDPARLTELFDRVDTAIRAMPDEGAAHRFSEEQIDRLETRIAESAREALSTQAAPDVAEERFARLERKLEEIGLASAAADGDLLSSEDLAELHSDIAALRRELRSLPGLGEGEGNFGEVLQSIAQRLDRLPDTPPATADELEAQVERITGLLDDPSHSRLALAHIETSLKTIEQRLEETKHALALRPTEGEGASAIGADVEAMASMARSLSDDVSSLKGTAEASEKKNKEALDAVQDTLEAVMKRMAFLERDAEMAAPEARRAELGDEAAAEDAAKAEAQLPDETAEAAEPAAELAEAEAESSGPGEAEALVERFESAPTEPAAVEDKSEPEAPAAAEPEAPADTAAKPKQSEPRSGGLLSRFTSRQLLKRATGGRAQSFTPEPEESEEESDFPIEPGTDSPLSSELTGAPSSDTHFMSGDRRSSREEPSTGDQDPGASALVPVEVDAAIDEDFLSAARRAARAAAVEAAEGDDPSAQSSSLGRISSTLKSRRGALMAAALAVAVAFAAFQIIRGQMSPDEPQVAEQPSASQPVASSGDSGDTEQAAPAASEMMQAEAPAITAPSPGGEVEATESAASDSGEGRAADTSTETASAAPASPATEPSAAKPATDDMAALDPTPQASDTTEPTAEDALRELPIGIGSQRLRDAAMAGNPSAAFEVAARYAEGVGGLKDMRTAVAWYERAAEAGLAPAQYRLGSIYEKGVGVPKDLAKAQSWYSRAAEAGNVKAMHNLAVLYAEGAGGEPDLERAAMLFRQAAERGVRDSQFNLAILHARGLGVPQDLIEAYKWFSVAATSGDAESARRRDIIGAALKEGDLAKAQTAAASFQPVPLVAEANEVPAPEGGWSDKQDSTSVEMQPPSEDTELGSTLSENDLVALVQKLLTDQGFDPGPTDGLLGERTMQAILKFQDRAGLPKTGVIDPGLVEALKGVSG